MTNPTEELPCATQPSFPDILRSHLDITDDAPLQVQGKAKGKGKGKAATPTDSHVGNSNGRSAGTLVRSWQSRSSSWQAEVEASLLDLERLLGVEATL